MNNIVYFRRWNWETDTGEEQITDINNLPKVYCEVMLDHRGFVYRVIQFNSDDIIFLDSENEDKTVYDYYCDEKGNVKEKRAFDDDGNIGLIVQYEYINGKKVAEVAWNPNSTEAPQKVKT